MKISSLSALTLLFCALYANGESSFSMMEKRELGRESVSFTLVGEGKREFLFFDIYDIGKLCC